MADAAAAEPDGGAGLDVLPELRGLDAEVRDMQKLGKGSASTQGGDGDDSPGVLVYPDLRLELQEPVGLTVVTRSIHVERASVSLAISHPLSSVPSATRSRCS